MGKGIWPLIGAAGYSFATNVQDVGLNHDVKKVKDRLTNDMITQHFKIEDDPHNIIHTKPFARGEEPKLKAPGLYLTCLYFFLYFIFVYFVCLCLHVCHRFRASGIIGGEDDARGKKQQI